MESIFIKPEQPTGFLVVQPVLTDGHFDRLSQLAQQRVGIKLHVVEHLAHRVALDDRLEHDVAAGVQAHVYGMGVAKQVVQVAQDLLIGAHQKHPEVIRLSGERVQA